MTVFSSSLHFDQVLAADSETVGVSSAKAPPGRQSFVVEAFRNVNGGGGLDYLCAGLPALVAERLGHLPPLRFVGPSAILGGNVGPADWTVGGEFTRVREKVVVTVSVKRTGQPGSQAVDDAQVVQASRSGSKEQLPQLTVTAALEALRKAAVGPTAEPPSAVFAPFARDPYAFVLYARGVGAQAGLRTRDNGQAAAKRWVTRALRIDPASVETMRYLGVIELADGSVEHARANWLGAIDRRPDYVAALADLARLDRECKRPSARERYARLVALDPDDTDARRAYGQLLADAGDLTAAKVELMRVLEVNPDDLAARRALVPVLAADHDLDPDHAGRASLENLEAMVRLDEGNLMTRLDLAAAYASVGELAHAEAAYDEVLRRKPRQAVVLKSAGDLAANQGHYGKALSYFSRMRALSPNDPRPVFRLGSVSFAAGDLKAAERWFDEAAHLPGMLAPAYANLGAIALKRGQTKQALWLLGRATKRRPGLVSAHFNLAAALVADGRPSEAIKELYLAEDLAPEDAGVRYFIGVVALRLDMPEEAEQAFRETLRLDPKHVDAAYNLGLLSSMHKPEREALLRL